MPPARRRRFAHALLTSLLLVLGGAAAAAQTHSLEPASTGGVAAIERDLAKLQAHARLLVVGAHPDDEDTSLLTLVARGMGGEAAYLSLSRGEGGQNLIGPELGIDLGLLRTQELLAARRVDGGRQYFTRAFDFGYTRSLEETLRRWPKETLLEDVVRVMRRFRPQVVVSIFPADGGGGHGQHQAAGVAAHEAFRLSGDAAALPQLESEGLAPWAPKTLYRATWFDREATTLVISTGFLDPVSGKSIYQLAMASRSQHRSQDMGRLQELGPQESRLGWVVGGEGAGSAVVFAGIDTRLRALAVLLPEGAERDRLWVELEAIEGLAAAARARLSPATLGTAAAPAREALERLRAVRAGLGERPAGGARAIADLVDEKIAAGQRALAGIEGLVLEASAPRAELVIGDKTEVTVALWNAAKTPLRVQRVELVSPAGWRSVSPAPPAQEVAPGALAKWTLEIEVPREAPATVPYFLRRPLRGDLYDWSATTAAERGEPFGPPPLEARVEAALDGLPLVLTREVVHRYSDQAVGEVRRPVRAVPKVEVALGRELIVWPSSATGQRPIEVSLTSHAAQPLAGRLETRVPPGWKPVAPLPFTLPAGSRESLRLQLAPAAGSTPASGELSVEALLESGERFEMAYPNLDYPHIRPTPRPVPAKARIAAVDVRLPPLRHIGYVRGASDRVPEQLQEIGLPIHVLDPRELLFNDLREYDAIVIGSRAYETEEALRRANGRLLDYVRGGGLVIVQYQQYPFIEGGYAPLPLAIARPHDRVTDESAPVRALDPAHPVFTRPNPLGEADWSGWVQERGLYFANTWDPGYTPLLEMADPGGAPQRGGLLVAKVGKGTYVYTGLAFFRQLPAGVPGAYRLFANLLALGT
jgi:LmbE family N-acetylglucosaminyl deacetylase